MDNPTSNGYSFQLPLFDFHDLRPSFFSEDEIAFHRYLSTIESLLTPVERKRLFSRPRTGRTGYSDFQILAIVVLKSFARCSTVREVLGVLSNEPNYRYIIGLGRTPSEGYVRKAQSK